MLLLARERLGACPFLLRPGTWAGSKTTHCRAARRRPSRNAPDFLDNELSVSGSGALGLEFFWTG
ncbi:MAG: hypothetical protein IPG91_09600 [Ideonella sp.]|nr:hypothetical protein [Ideonella sp.]